MHIKSNCVLVVPELLFSVTANLQSAAYMAETRNSKGLLSP